MAINAAKSLKMNQKGFCLFLQYSIFFHVEYNKILSLIFIQHTKHLLKFQLSHGSQLVNVKTNQSMGIMAKRPKLVKVSWTHSLTTNASVLMHVIGWSLATMNSYTFKSAYCAKAGNVKSTMHGFIR